MSEPYDPWSEAHPSPVNGCECASCWVEREFGVADCAVFLGCECGADEHPGVSHEGALACEDAACHGRCSCDPWWVDGEVVHETDCECSPFHADRPDIFIAITDLGAGRSILRDAGHRVAGRP